jgi:hypothetical protein
LEATKRTQRRNDVTAGQAKAGQTYQKYSAHLKNSAH